MTLEVPDILKHEGQGPARFEDPANIEEERSLRFARKPMCSPQSILLGYAGDRERLARESCDQNVVLRNSVANEVGDVVVPHALGRGDLRDVACYRVRRLEVRRVGLHRILVVLRGEDTLAAGGLKAQSRPADTGEQIDEGEVVIRRHFLVRFRDEMKHGPQDHPGLFDLAACFPAL